MIREALLAEMAERVAARHEIRLAAKRACVSVNRTASAHGLLERALVAAAEGALVPEDGSPVRTAGLANLARKFKQIATAVKRFPRLWDKVKEFLGVEGLADLPGKIKDLAKEGYKALQRAVTKAFSVWPLKLFTLPESKVFSLNALLEKLAAASPRFMKFMRESVRPRVDQFQAWLDKNLPMVNRALLVAIYVWIWLNVVEFEWDLDGLIRAATGQISLADLLASLPGSAIGFLMNALNLGTFSLFPAATAVRVLFVLASRYVEWTGSTFRVRSENVQADFGFVGDAWESIKSSFEGDLAFA